MKPTYEKKFRILKTLRTELTALCADDEIYLFGWREAFHSFPEKGKFRILVGENWNDYNTLTFFKNLGFKTYCCS